LETSATALQIPFVVAPTDARMISAAASILEGDEGGVVFIWGSAAFAWDTDDEAARRYAAVQLVRNKAATARAVANAFGVTTMTLWRWSASYEDSGIVGLVANKKGPKGQRLVDARKVSRIHKLRDQGKSLRAIAAAIGTSTQPVRHALGLTGPRAAARGDEEMQDEGATLSGVDETDTTLDVERALLPLPLPVPRVEERVAARVGLLDEAAPVFTEGAGLPRLGTLLVLPALKTTGLIEAGEAVYRRLRNGFYGLTSMLLMMVFLALMREPRAEGATRLPPADLGRLLGLDRAPEVKTIRRKLAEMAGHKAGSELVSELARNHVKVAPEELGYLYLDGHVRVYSGTRDLQEAHVTRMRISAPATLETWACDMQGDPVFVVTSPPSASLVSEIHRLLPELRTLVGERRITIVFDRGGWSPGLFAEIVEAGFDFLTYRKGKCPVEPKRAFVEQTYTADDVPHVYMLSDRMIRLRLEKSVVGKRTFTCRQVVRLCDNGHQTHIVTSKQKISAAEIAYRMFNRWREENYFRYGREHFALDSLDSYAADSDDLTREVPNPKRKDIQTRLKKARADLQKAMSLMGKATTANREAKRPTMRGFKIANADLTATVSDAEAKVARLEERLSNTPARLPLAEVRPNATLLDEERKLVTHAIRMATYNAESSLARMLIGSFPLDESRSLLREAFNTPGDLSVHDGILDVRIDPLSAPRRTRALAALCEQLTATKTTYPGTPLVIRYAMKSHPGIS